MANMKCKAGKPLHPSKNIQQLLSDMDEELYRLLCVSRFYRTATEAIMYQVQHDDAPDLDTDWQYGLFLVGEWIEESGQAVLQQLDLAREQHGRH